MKISEATFGLCECGCGQKTTVPRWNSFSIGVRAGVPKRFVHGHQRRKRGLPVGVLIDAVDADLARDSWVLTNLDRGGYAYRSIYDPGTKRARRESMHRIIAARIIGRPLSRSEEPDHINGNGLDNRRSNLRVVTRAINGENRTRHDRRNKSGYRGVVWHAQRKKWAAQATFRRRHIHIGLFDRVEDAAAASHQWRVENMPGYTGAPSSAR